MDLERGVSYSVNWNRAYRAYRNTEAAKGYVHVKYPDSRFVESTGGWSPCKPAPPPKILERPSSRKPQKR